MKSDPPTFPLVLDTHTWIWMTEAHPRLSRSIAAILEKAAKEQQLLLPSICLWEIAMLVSKKKLSLTQPFQVWTKTALAAPGPIMTELTPEIAFEAYQLPEEFHGDPADRLITATARIHGATLVTQDQQILDYGYAGHLKVLEAGK